MAATGSVTIRYSLANSISPAFGGWGSGNSVAATAPPPSDIAPSSPQGARAPYIRIESPSLSGAMSPQDPSRVGAARLEGAAADPAWDQVDRSLKRAADRARADPASHAAIALSSQVLAEAERLAAAAEPQVDRLRGFVIEQLAPDSPHRGRSNSAAAWQNRTIAALLRSGVLDVEDSANGPGLRALCAEGVLRDRMRGAGSALVSYLPAFGLGSVVAGSLRATSSGPPSWEESGRNLGLVGLAIGTGGELSGSLAAGLGPQYTRDTKVADRSPAAQRVYHTRFWPFTAAHSVLDAVARFGEKPFNVAFARLASGAVAAAGTGLVSAYARGAAVAGEAAWLDGDEPVQMAARIASLKETRLLASSGWFRQLWTNFTRKAPGVSPNAASALLRMALVSAVLAPRAFMQNPAAATGDPDQDLGAIRGQLLEMNLVDAYPPGIQFGQHPESKRLVAYFKAHLHMFDDEGDLCLRVLERLVEVCKAVRATW